MKALIILSGGADSSTALWWAKKNKKFDYIEALFIFYGSRQNKTEIQYAKKQCRELGVKLNIINIETALKGFNSLLLDENSKIPNAKYDSENLQDLVVPFRNGIFLSLAAGLASSKGFDYIILGNHSGDHELYPDCRANFIKAIKQAILLGTDNQVKVLSPFCKLLKSEIIKKGAELGVNYKNTYSCYTGKKIHCGECPTCRERKEAFLLNKIKDNTIYERN